MLKRSLLVLSLVLLVLPVAPVRAATQDVTFVVDSLQEPGVTRTIAGTMHLPDCEATAVVLLQHGLSYTRRAWDRPGLSVVQPLVDAGFAVLVIDRLGYGASTLPNGYDVSSESHANNTRQIVDALRGSFEHVVIGGHSAGAETSLLAAGAFGVGDAVLALGYHHYPSQQIVTDFFTGDFVRAAQDDYEYFLGTPEHRAGMFYTEAASSDVIADDTANAVLTPSGEIYTIGKQPSRYVAAAIDVPVFLQLGDSDRLFPVEFAPQEVALFASAPEVTVDVVGSAGHTFMLHPTGPAGSARLADWVAARFPGC
jgi:pimeloyl-ACP methyl ester carboxylesterase